MAKKRGMVASAFTSTRRAIGRYLPGARTEAKAEAAIDNLLVLLRETRKSLRAVARLRGGGRKRRSKAGKRKTARPMRRKRSAKRKSRR